MVLTASSHQSIARTKDVNIAEHQNPSVGGRQDGFSFMYTVAAIPGLLLRGVFAFRHPMIIWGEKLGAQRGDGKAGLGMFGRSKIDYSWWICHSGPLEIWCLGGTPR